MARETGVEAAPDGPGPNRPSRPRPWHRIRFKLFLVSLTLLGIPWAAYLFVQETELFLRDAQEQTLQTTAGLVANIMHGHDDAFHGIARADSILTFRNLFLHELHEAPQLDGYRDDWGRYRHNFSRLQSVDERLEARVLLGSYGRHIYLLLSVRDPEPRYGDQGDAVDLALTDRTGQLRRYRFQPLAPGWVAARPVLPAEAPNGAPRPDPAIRGEWQKAADGYTLEVRLPRDLLSDRLSLRLFDSSSGQVLANGPMAPAKAIGRVVQRSTRLDRVLAPLTPAATRIWVTDHQGLVLASAGRLDADAPLSPDQSAMPWFIRDLLLAVLPSEADTESTLRKDRTQLFVRPVVDALAGRPSNLRRQPPAGDAVVVSAAVPIRSSQGIRGAVLVEQTTSAVLSAENLALQRLFGVTLVFFAVTGLGLLGFASLLASRIIRLRNEVELALANGTSPMIVPMAIQTTDQRGDEIDALRNHFARLSAERRDAGRALGAITARRTNEPVGPDAALHRSVDADDPSQRPDDMQLARIDTEVRQLEGTLSRLREAWTLRRSGDQALFRTFDLAALIHRQSIALSKHYNDSEIALGGTDQPINLHGVPELIGQAIDTLVGRIWELHQPDGGVRIDSRVHQGRIDIEVRSNGGALTSSPHYEDAWQAIEARLGLDLYVVRQIGALHGGSAAVALQGTPPRLVLRLSLQHKKPAPDGQTAAGTESTR